MHLSRIEHRGRICMQLVGVEGVGRPVKFPNAFVGCRFR